MKKELGIARCGLACCLCAKNTQCNGCHADDCAGSVWCEVRRCCIEKGVMHCFECEDAEHCQKGVLSKLKPHAFTVFAKKYGMEKLLECLENNEKHGVTYHRDGIVGDYDDFSDMNELFKFIEEGKRNTLEVQL